MIIYFLRHANAGETRKDSKKDERRGIDPQGIQESYQLARLFSRLDVAPDLIITSPLKRAMQTGAMVANELGYDDKLRIEKTLKPDAKWEDFRSMLKSQDADTVIIVGHSPNLPQPKRKSKPKPKPKSKPKRKKHKSIKNSRPKRKSK